MPVKVARVIVLGNCRPPTWALAGAVPAALILQKARRSAPPSTIHHRKNHPSAQAAQDEAGVKASNFQAKGMY